MANSQASLQVVSQGNIIRFYKLVEIASQTNPYRAFYTFSRWTGLYMRFVIGKDLPLLRIPVPVPPGITLAEQWNDLFNRVAEVLPVEKVDLFCAHATEVLLKIAAVDTYRENRVNREVLTKLDQLLQDLREKQPELPTLSDLRESNYRLSRLMHALEETLWSLKTDPKKWESMCSGNPLERNLDKYCVYC